MKITLQKEGMMCGMCEVRVNDGMGRELAVGKVSSSRKKGETVILAEGPLDLERLKETVKAAGYQVLSAREEPYEKRGLFSRR